MIVVRSFHELNVRCAEAKDKIVVFNPLCAWQAQPLAFYGLLTVHRVGGASFAAKCGAMLRGEGEGEGEDKRVMITDTI